MVVDYFIIWIEGKVIVIITESVVATFMHKNILTRYSIPRILTSDNGTQFVGRGLRQFCEGYSIKQRFMFINHPQVNKLVESVNQKKILNGLKKRLDSTKGLWANELHSLVGFENHNKDSHKVDFV